MNDLQDRFTGFHFQSHRQKRLDKESKPMLKETHKLNKRLIHYIRGKTP